MKLGSIPLGQVAGISLRVHWTALVVAVVLCASLGRVTGYPMAIASLAALALSILAHEFGHAIAARYFGIGTESIDLWALGGAARLRREPSTPLAEGTIAAAGPVTSAALAVAALCLWIISGRPVEPAIWAVLLWAGVMNALLAVTNLLPGAPLDGGRIVKAIRWAQHGNRYRASREAARAGIAIAWLFVVGGVWLITRGQAGIWLVLTGIFVGVSARVEVTTSRVSEHLDGVRVGDLTWYGVASAGTDTDTEAMLEQRSRLGGADGLTVTDARGVGRGVVLLETMLAVPVDQRHLVLLANLMVPFDRTARAHVDDELNSILPSVDLRHPIVTVWDGEQLVGLVPPRRFRDRLAQAGLPLG